MKIFASLFAADLAVLTVSCAVCSVGHHAPVARDYHFEGTISREVLEIYLSRSITFCELLNPRRTESELGSNTDESVRFLTDTGAKFIGRALYMWGKESRIEQLLRDAKPVAERIHAVDPDIVLQACAFEIVTTDVENVRVPRWVFEAFGLEHQDRGFSFPAMRYKNGQQEGKWSNPNAIVPDMSQLETRMWFYFLSCSYIDIGVEAIHFGQVEIMDNADPDHVHWDDMLGRVRCYAAKHARRRMLLADAHVPTGGVVLRDGRLLLDFHSFPLRIEEMPGPGQQGHLKLNHSDSIYGKSNGGITPSGWTCESLPYIVELDNFGSSGKEDQDVGQHWIWGYDEIGWFARQECEYRDQWLYYAWCWIRKHDANGYLQMPGARVLHSPADGNRWYWANTASDVCPTGFGQEEAIKTIWASDL